MKLRFALPTAFAASTALSACDSVGRNERRSSLLRAFTLSALATIAGTAAMQSAAAAESPPVVKLSATPVSVASGESSALSWTSENARICRSSGAWTATTMRTDGKTSTGPLAESKTYILTCEGYHGESATSTVTVSVAGSVAKGTGTATLSWKPPTTNTNGTPVTPLKGYTIYYGTSADSMSKSLVVSGAASTSCEIGGLTAGTWYFAITADAQDGTQSAASNIGSLAI